MKKTLLLLAMLLTVTFVWSQRVIKGKVVETGNNEPIIGANIVAKGTKVVTTTDIDGNYSISVPKEVTQLEFTYVGMETQTITLGTSNVLDISMKGEKALEELVVVGYGTQKRKDLTGSISSITSENFVKGPIQTPEQLVSGKVAGVQITSNSGQPGSGSTIRIRGGSSLNASNDPLIVIDGVPLDNGTINGAANPLGFVNPSDIESITVLKDASATAIYGARAANGVIMIVTKKGEKGKMKINFNTLVSVGQLTKKVDVFDATSFRNFLKNNPDGNKYVSLLGDTTTNTDWQNAIYRSPVSIDNNLSASGILSNVPYRVSVNYLKQNGLLLNSNMDRLGASVGLSPTFFNKSLKVDVNYKVAQLKNNFADQGAIGSAVGFDPTQKIYDESNTAMGGYFEWRSGNTPNSNAPRNPLSLLELKKDQSTTYRHIGNVQLDYKIPFIKGLRANLNIGADGVQASGNKSNPAISASAINTKGTYGKYYQNKLNRLLEFYLNYNKQIGVHKVELTAGHAYQNFYNETRGYDRELTRKDSVVQIPDTSRFVIASFFGRAIYSLKEKYLLTLTLRADATSKFSPETRWGYFPSAAFAWKINEESFLKEAKSISDLKLRVGFGITGQQEGIGNYAYQTIFTESQSTVNYNLGEKFINTYRPEGYDRGLKWEETANANIGLDYGFLNGKVFGSIDVYNRNTYDLISEITVPAGSNLKNKIVTNVGKMNNKGIEILLNTIVINSEKSNLTFGFNATRNINKITALYKNNQSGIGLETGGIAGIGQNIQVNSVNFSRNAFFVFKQVYDTNGKPIEGIYVDINGDGKINDTDRYRYKSSVPQWTIGFNTQYRINEFSAGFTMRANLGNYVYNNIFSQNGNYNQLNAVSAVRNLSTNIEETQFKNAQLRSDYYIENASFLRMDNIYFGYDFNKIIKSNISLRATFSIQNAFVVTKYKGIDPEIFSGLDNNLYPRARTYAIGINLGF